jgi:hypothetical protein
METYYLNLIAKSYIKLTKENDDNLAIFFFQKDNKLKRKNGTPKNQFFNKLIENIENLINNSYNKAKEPDLSGIPDEHRIDQENELKRKKNNFLYKMDLYYLDCDLQGIPYYIPNWEICTDATKLTDALINDYVELKDPIAIITPSKKISKKELIVRKSKLEYLISEAERAREANNIEELNVESIKKEQIKEEINTPTSFYDIEETVIKHFQFTVEIDDRKKKQMLSQEEFLKLVSWVTSFFENNYELPHIDTPIMEVHIGKTKIKSAFKKLIHIYHSKRPKPKSFYTLVAKCFYVLQDETEASIQKTSDPDKPVN